MLLASTGAPPPCEVLSLKVYGKRPLKDGAILAKFRIRELPGFQGKVRMNYQVPCRVTFDETITMPVPNKWADEVLENTRIFVDDRTITPLMQFIQ